MLNPATAPFGVGMFVAGMKTAASGILISSYFIGLDSIINGNNFFNGVSKIVVNNFMDGFTIGALLYCGASAISAISKAINRPKTLADVYRAAEKSGTNVYGTPKWLPQHKQANIDKAFAMAESGNYSDIYFDMGIKRGVPKLTTTNYRPDIIGVLRSGQGLHIYEFPGITQIPGAPLHNELLKKIKVMSTSYKGTILNSDIYVPVIYK